MSRPLLAGAARVIINPPLGINRPGIRIFRDPIQAIESDLTATALVVGNGEDRVAIVALDLIFLSLPVITEIRRQLAEAIGIPPAHVMVNFSHTHGGPATPDFIDDTPEQTALQEKYLAQLRQWLVAVVRSANDRLQPARIGHGRGECHIGVYRRAKTSTGRDVLGEVPNAPIDPAVGVVRVDDLQGQPIATLFSYGCHPVSMGPRAFVASADYPGASRRVIETCLGGLSLFLQGCGGNINPLWGIGYEIDGRDSKDRLGQALGGEVVKVASLIRTNVQRGEPTPIGPLSNILLRPWHPVQGHACTSLAGIEEIVTLEYGPLPSLPEAQAIYEQCQRRLADDLAQGVRDWNINYSARFVHWSQRLVNAVSHGHPTLDTVVQVLRINDVVLCGLSVETFFETGLALKARSPLPATEVLGYTNGCAGYLPRAEDYPPEGWNVHEKYAVPDMFFQSYSLPVALRPDSEQTVVARAMHLLCQIAQR